MLSGLTKYLDGCDPRPHGLLEGSGTPPAHRPDRVLFFGGWHHRDPSVVVDISGHFDVKKKAVYAHKSQFFAPESEDPETLLSQPRFEDWLEQRARHWGLRIGVEHGEPLTVKGEVRVDDPVSTFEGCPW